MRIRSLFIIIACVTSLALGHPVAANDPEQGKIYQWQDAQGILHITDSLEKVPKKYRSSIKIVEVEPPPVEEGQALGQSGGAQQKQAAPAPAADNEEQLKRAWQQRMREAKDNVMQLTEQLQSQEMQLRMLKDRGGSGQYYTEDMAAQVKQLEEKVKDTRNALDQSRKSVEEDIPDAARKAGIPPGWLRE